MFTKSTRVANPQRRDLQSLQILNVRTMEQPYPDMKPFRLLDGSPVDFRINGDESDDSKPWRQHNNASLLGLESLFEKYYESLISRKYRIDAQVNARGKRRITMYNVNDEQLRMFIDLFIVFQTTDEGQLTTTYRPLLSLRMQSLGFHDCKSPDMIALWRMYLLICLAVQPELLDSTRYKYVLFIIIKRIRSGRGIPKLKVDLPKMTTEEIALVFEDVRSRYHNNELENTTQELQVANRRIAEEHRKRSVQPSKAHIGRSSFIDDSSSIDDNIGSESPVQRVKRARMQDSFTAVSANPHAIGSNSETITMSRADLKHLLSNACINAAGRTISHGYNYFDIVSMPDMGRYNAMHANLSTKLGDEACSEMLGTNKHIFSVAVTDPGQIKFAVSLMAWECNMRTETPIEAAYMWIRVLRRAGISILDQPSESPEAVNYDTIGTWMVNILNQNIDRQLLGLVPNGCVEDDTEVIDTVTDNTFRLISIYRALVLLGETSISEPTRGMAFLMMVGLIKSMNDTKGAFILKSVFAGRAMKHRHPVVSISLIKKYLDSTIAFFKEAYSPQNPHRIHEMYLRLTPRQQADFIEKMKMSADDLIGVF